MGHTHKANNALLVHQQQHLRGALRTRVNNTCTRMIKNSLSQRQMSQTNRSADTKTPRAEHSGSRIVIQGRTTAFHGGYLHLMQRALASDGTHNTTMQYDNNTNTYARRATYSCKYNTFAISHAPGHVRRHMPKQTGIVHTGLQHERASTMML